jgi:hypothetical protein
MTWLTGDGYLIEVVSSTPDDDFRDHQLHVTRHGAEIGYFTTIGDLRQVVDLSGLHAVDTTDIPP